MKYIHILLIGFLIVGVIIAIYLFYRFSFSSSSSPSTSPFDDSDIPIPPNTLEYSKTYSPPKRNCDLSSSSAPVNPTVHIDDLNGSYTFISGDRNYNL